jgi:hypothetical protein
LTILLGALHDLNEEKGADDKIPVSEDTILMGTGTPLDSLGFVVFVTNAEEKLNDATGMDLSISSDLHLFEDDTPFHTVSTLADYIVTLMGGTVTA